MDGEFLSMHLPKTWLLGKYKQHRERVLLDREMALLPASQELLRNYRDGQRLRQSVEEWENERRAMKIRSDDLAFAIAGAQARLATMERTHYAQGGGGVQEGAAATERRQFVRACPVDACRGFLSTAWKCGTCDARVCRHCGEVKGGAGSGDEDGAGCAADAAAHGAAAVHVCDPAVAASHALLQKDSKPCPQCASVIFKVGGCDQMWCTQCNVAFNWKSGKVVTRGAIHNPHYFEWMRRTQDGVPRQPGDVPCGGLPGARELDTVFRSLGGYDEVNLWLSRVYQRLQHLVNEELPRLRRAAGGEDDEVRRNADLRLQYLLHRIDEAGWKRKLQQREKKREKAFAEMQVYEMFVAAASDTFRAVANDRYPPRLAQVQTRQLQQFADTALSGISKRFNMTVGFLSTDNAPPARVRPLLPLVHRGLMR